MSVPPGPRESVPRESAPSTDTVPGGCAPSESVPRDLSRLTRGPGLPDLEITARPPDAPPTPGILAAVDGSDGSLWALDRAMTEAELFKLPLYVLAVVNPAPAAHTLGMADVVQEGVERLLSSMRDGVRRSIAAVQQVRSSPYTGPTSVHVVLGDVIEVLLSCAAHHHTLVMGTRGNGGFARLLLGSVSTAAIHHSASPVLIVPAPAAVGQGHP